MKGFGSLLSQLTVLTVSPTLINFISLSFCLMSGNSFPTHTQTMTTNIQIYLVSQLIKEALSISQSSLATVPFLYSCLQKNSKEFLYVLSHIINSHSILNLLQLHFFPHHFTGNTLIKYTFALHITKPNDKFFIMLHLLVVFNGVHWIKEIIMEISPEYSLERLILKLKLQYFGYQMWRTDSLKAGGEGDDRRWDGWMASPTQWTWVWWISGSCWWTGKPGVLQSMGLQRVGHNWATDLNCMEYIFLDFGTHSTLASKKFYSPGFPPSLAPSLQSALFVPPHYFDNKCQSWSSPTSYFSSILIL